MRERVVGLSFGEFFSVRREKLKGKGYEVKMECRSKMFELGFFGWVKVNFYI